MRHFPSEKALVTAYWRKLARSNRTASRERRGGMERDADLRHPAGVVRRRYPLIRQVQLQSS